MNPELRSFITKYMTLTDDEERIISDLALFRTLDKGAFLLREGARCNESYFVLKGCIRVYYIIDGIEKTTAFYTELETFTPQSTTNNSPSEYYVSCVEPSLVLISTPEIERISFERFPRFETLCRLLSEDLLSKSQASFDQFKISTPEQRYRQLIDTRPDLIQRIPQHMLASYLGITPESLSRLRKRMWAQAYY